MLKRRRFDRLTFRDLQNLYLNRSVKVGEDDKGRPNYKKVADVWLTHPERRQFIHGVTFDPTGRAPHGTLNLWEGFQVKPAKGDWSIMRDHIANTICDGDKVRYSSSSDG